MAEMDALEAQEQVLNDNRDFLIKYLDPDDISDQLIQEGMLGKNAAQQVQLHAKSRMEKNRTIIDQLTIGGPGTLQKFCDILKGNKRLAFIAEKLEMGKKVITCVRNFVMTSFILGSRPGWVGHDACVT